MKAPTTRWLRKVASRLPWSKTNGGFRCRWLARATRGRIGLGTWTKAEVDRIQAAAKAQADEFSKYID